MKTAGPTLFICTAFATSAMLLSAALPASADQMWDWSYKCSLLDTQTKCKGGSGTFTTSEQQGSGGDAYYLVTAITGTVEGNTITSLLPPDSLGFSNDNKIQPPIGQAYINSGSKVTGIGFLTNNDPATDANANELYNIFIDSVVGYATQIAGPNNLALENIDFSDKNVGTVSVGESSPVPEPSSLSFVTLGCLTLAGALKKAFR